MGMYTELVLKCRFDSTIDPVATKIVEYLFGDGNPPEESELPDHQFFKCPRWDFIGKSGSFYHHPNPESSIYKGSLFGEYYIFSRSDLKNYDNEIQHFIDWISPYLHNRRECIGWTWYEEAEKPDLLFLEDKGE